MRAKEPESVVALPLRAGPFPLVAPVGAGPVIPETLPVLPAGAMVDVKVVKVPLGPEMVMTVGMAGEEPRVDAAASALDDAETAASMLLNGARPGLPMSAVAVLPAATTVAEAAESLDAEASEDTKDEAETEAEAEADEVLDEDVALAEQERSYSGVVLEEPMTPKLGLGVVGAASWTVYQYVFAWPNSLHPTSSQ